MTYAKQTTLTVTGRATGIARAAVKARPRFCAEAAAGYGHAAERFQHSGRAGWVWLRLMWCAAADPAALPRTRTICCSAARFIVPDCRHSCDKRCQNAVP
eukprot:361140-Chlamydomonas_euryale.AAC.4